MKRDVSDFGGALLFQQASRVILGWPPVYLCFKKIVSKMTTKKLQQSTPERRIKGTIYQYADDSLQFLPACTSGEVLYNATLAKTHSGSIKQTDKSIVMRIIVDGNPTDLRAALLSKTAELICQLPNTTGDPLLLPDVIELIGETPHSKIYLRNGKALVISEMAFDEPNPKIAGFAGRASPEQLKLLKPFIEPEDAYLMEVSKVTQLIHAAKDRQGEINEYTNNSIKI